MALGLEGKKAIVGEVSEIASSALSAVLAEYRGMTVEQMTALRVKARESGVYLRVVRNTLAKRAVENTEFACLNDALVGQVICAFSLEEPGAAARLIRDFAKDCDKLNATAIAIGGTLHSAEQLDAVAKLPTKDEAIASLMSVMNGPVTKLARTLNEFPSRITRVINAVADQKKQAA
ncbi:50S ribosomal protein L10 [Aliikangiella sp. IMCC44653]